MVWINGAFNQGIAVPNVLLDRSGARQWPPAVTAKAAALRARMVRNGRRTAGLRPWSSSSGLPAVPSPSGWVRGFLQRIPSQTMQNQ